MTNDIAPIEIPLSKKKMIMTFLGSLAFVAMGLWFVIDPPTINHSFFGNPTLILVAGVASILFFGLVAVYIARKLPNSKPGLIIDNIGLTDNSSAVASGRILWSDVEDISILEIHRQKLIMLEVKNPQEYIDRQTNRFARRMMQTNFNMYGTPLSITSNALDINHDELIELLSQYFLASKV